MQDAANIACHAIIYGAGIFSLFSIARDIRALIAKVF
jgi:hypothetical protein